MKPALLGRTASGRVSGDEAEDTLRKAEKK